MDNMNSEIESVDFNFEHPDLKDGYEVNQLVKQCKPLDENSVYCNILQCYHFKDTSICVRYSGEICGFVSGYIIPQTNSLFIWQVAVSETQRGKGLALKMISKILESEACSNVNNIKTSITNSNTSSQRLFTKIADKYSTQIKSEAFINQANHFNGEHESEYLYTVGPLCL